MTTITHTTYAAKAVLMIDQETTSELHLTMAQALGDAFGSVAELGYEVGPVDTMGDLVGADVFDVDGVRHGSIMIYPLRAGQR